MLNKKLKVKSRLSRIYRGFLSGKKSITFIALILAAAIISLSGCIVHGGGHHGHHYSGHGGGYNGHHYGGHGGHHSGGHHGGH